MAFRAVVMAGLVLGALANTSAAETVSFPGDDVTLTVKDAQGKERKVSYRLSKDG